MNNENESRQPALSKSELKAVLLYFLISSIVYHLVLWYNRMGFESEGYFGWMNLRGYWFSSGMQYVFLLLDSALVWFLAVYLLRKKAMRIQLITVALLIPFSIYLVRELFYLLLDAMKLARLRGTGTVWDWYIPTLVLYIIFGCFFAYRYFIENQRKLKLEGELRQAALKSELSAIKAQLNPHFLYNVFNTINASLPPENEITRQMIGELSDLFRYQLKATREDLVPLAEELEFVRKYLDLEKARFEDRLQVDIDVAPDCLTEKVPPMILQPLVENSIRHGLSGLIQGGSIRIVVFKQEGRLFFEIADTGVGVRDKDALFGKGIGLTNTRLRLQKMYDSHLELFDNDPRGLKVRFSL